MVGSFRDTRLGLLLVGCLTALLLVSGDLLAQVIVLPRPRPEAIIEFESFRLHGQVTNQVARISASLTLTNRGSAPAEAVLLLPVPPGTTLHGVTLLADGQELTGELLRKEEATREYMEIVRRYRDPALVEYADSDLYRARIFPIPPKGSRRLDLSLTFACRSDQGLVQLVLPVPRQTRRSLSPRQVQVNLTVTDSRPIRSIFTTTPGLKTDVDGKHRATIRGSLQQPADVLRIYYRLGGERITAWALSTWPANEQDGYFMLFLTPPALPEPDSYQPKDLVLVIDRSGSMSGEKIEQVREALAFVLRRLHPEDRFNLISYADEALPLSDRLLPATEENVARGLKAAEGLAAQGGTNIYEALDLAFAQLEPREDRPGYVLFLTDGRPTVGTTSEGEIAALVRRKSQTRARLICFGVGHDVNSRLLDRIAQLARGTTIYVPPNEDLERYVSGLYRTIAAPALTDVRVTIQGVSTSYVYPKDVPDLFAGTQVTVVGRYRGEGSEVVVRVSGKYRGDTQRFSVPVRFVGPGEGLADAFVARVWAGRRIAYLLDQIETSSDPSDELVDEVIRLARKFNIVTPYTSFLAEEPLDTDTLRARSQVTGFRVRSTGAAAFRARSSKSALRAARVGTFAGAAAVGPLGLKASLLAAEPGPTGIRNRVYLGGRTFERRGDVWVELTLADADLRKAKEVVLYSDAFFSIIKQLPAPVRAVFALDGPVYMRIGQTVYKFVEPKQN